MKDEGCRLGPLMELECQLCFSRTVHFVSLLTPAASCSTAVRCPFHSLIDLKEILSVLVMCMIIFL